MSMEIHYGNAVTGNQRFARPKLERKLMGVLEQSAGIKMFGLRRIGKSTARLFVCEELEKQGTHYTYVDAQGLHSIEDLLAELFVELQKIQSEIPAKILNLFTDKHPVRRVLDSLIKGSKMGERLSESLWQETLNGIKTAMQQSDNHIVLVIDEFSLLLGNILRNNTESGLKEVSSLLSSMREWRDAGMKMFLTGSIGVSALARKYQFDVDHLNDLQVVNVPELDDVEARSFVEQATTKNRDYWNDDIITEFLNQAVVLYPSFLVKGIMSVDIEQPDVVDMASYFAEEVRPQLNEDFYNQLFKRFQLYQKIDKQWQTQSHETHFVKST